MCRKCGKTGHLKVICRAETTMKKKPSRQGRSVRRVEEDSSDKETNSWLYHVGSHGQVVKTPPIKVSIKIDDCLVGMDVDTGASVSLMSESAFRLASSPGLPLLWEKIRERKAW